MDSLANTRDQLVAALEDQRKASIAANDNARRLAEQQLMYKNEAAGSLYSGTPTFQRAQLASKHAGDLANINKTYAKNKVSVWNQVQNTLDQVAAIQEAIKFYEGNPAISVPSVSRSPMVSTPFYVNGKLYVYENGKMREA